MNLSIQFNMASETLSVLADNKVVLLNASANHTVVRKIQDLMETLKVKDEPIKHELMRAWSKAFDRIPPITYKATTTAAPPPSTPPQVPRPVAPAQVNRSNQAPSTSTASTEQDVEKVRRQVLAFFSNDDD